VAGDFAVACFAESWWRIGPECRLSFLAAIVSGEAELDFDKG